MVPYGTEGGTLFLTSPSEVNRSPYITPHHSGVKRWQVAGEHRDETLVCAVREKTLVWWL